MRVLLDSHALIWYVDQDHLLSKVAHSTITDASNDLSISAATIWEVAIKTGLRKMSLSLPYHAWMTKAIFDLRLSILPVTLEYADVQSRLPDHHRDPFDRLLVAQAQVEGIPIVSADVTFDRYGVTRIW